jgi:uncharacterized membrane protein YfcA
MKAVLFVALGIITAVFVALWIAESVRVRRGRNLPDLRDNFVGFVTNFFDTLGIGSFATTTSFFKLWRMVPDDEIPGTLNIGHTIPSVVQAFIFITIVQVDITTLALLIGASVVGSWLGAGVVARWPRRKIQIGMGIALLGASALMLLSQVHVLPGGGELLGLTGIRLVVATLANVVFGALMTLGIGLYAPCMIVTYLMGMSPKAVFPIMMGSCAFLMPVGSVRFLRVDRYSLKAALGLLIGGVPGVLIAAFLVRSLPLHTMRWLVIAVVVYTALMMLRSSARARSDVAAAETSRA